MWRNTQYNLILTDCHMPNMDGYQLTGAIRAEEAEGDAHIPIIATAKRNALHCGRHGAYLAKPVTLGIDEQL